MSRDLTNFLSEEKKRAFRERYLARVLTVGVCMLLVVLLAHIALMFPTYMFVRQEHDVKAKHLAEITHSAEQSQQEEISRRIASLHNNLKRLNTFTAEPHSMPKIKSVLGVAREGIHITSVSSELPGEGGGTFTMRVIGTADTREGLRAYQLALSSLPFVTSADLPLSAFAKESEIPFSITIMGKETP